MSPPESVVERKDDFLQAVEALLSRKDEPGWVRSKRWESWEIFEGLPMPSSNEEEWRRSDLRALKLQQFSALAKDTKSHLPESLKTDSDKNGKIGGILVQNDGFPHYRDINDDLAHRGVILTDLQTAAKERPDLVEPHFMTDGVTPGYNKFTALHGALWTGGVFLYVPKGVEVELPLKFLVGLTEPGQADFSHTLIIADEGSQVTLTQEDISTKGDAPGLHIGALEIFVKPGADVNYLKVQNWNQKVWNFSHERAIVSRDANLRWVSGAFGSRFSKLNQEVTLDGSGSHAEMLGVLFSNRRQHIDFHTGQQHKAPHTTSDLLYKGALKDRSRSVWRGMIRVHPHAQRTDAYQVNNNLILSEDARADSIPGLEIEADDVRCTHGATIGQLDEEQFFYLMSRGIPHKAAERMIIEGFFEQVFERIPVESVKEDLRTAVERKLLGII